jgi:hypothetical protein
MLLLAAGLGFTMAKLDDTDARDHSGVTYKATVRRGEVVVAECDGFAGYDETRFYRPADGAKPEYRAPWNTVVKMAQKRALVGAALNATAASGLFVADVDDDERPPPRARRGPGSRSPSAKAQRTTPAPATLEGTDALEDRLRALSIGGREAFKDWRRSRGYDWPPIAREILAEMAGEVSVLEAERDAEADTYEPPVGSRLD